MRGPSPQAVILASDTGARLYPLNGPATPKALLPVGNRPLLSFPLAMIEHSGIRHVLVVSSYIHPIYMHLNVCASPSSA